MFLSSAEIKNGWSFLRFPIRPLGMVLELPHNFTVAYTSACFLHVPVRKFQG